MTLSNTAAQRGFGSDRYKSVIGLTPPERAAARSGEIVAFRSDRISGGGNGTGTYWRVVSYRKRAGREYFDPRVPTTAQLMAIENTIEA